MKKLLSAIFIALFSIMQFTGAEAANKDFKVAVVYNVGGKFDKSFNESAYRGAQRFKDEFGINYVDFEPQNVSQFEQAIRRFAKRVDIILLIGFSFDTPLKNLADKYPNTKFVIVDGFVIKPNVKAITFKEHEGSFLVGMLAAMKSETGKVGFIGGQDIPLIRKFQLGYEEGAKYANPDVVVFKNMTGSTGAAWSDPVRGGELTRSQIDRGVDVVYAAAGGTGVGVLQTAADKEIFAIGVDSNQNHMHPGTMLSSMVKNVDQAVYQTLVDFMNGQFEAGHHELGLAENGVDYAVDQYNESLLDDATVKKIEQAKKDIINGSIVVPDYTKQGN